MNIYGKRVILRAMGPSDCELGEKCLMIHRLKV